MWQFRVLKKMMNHDPIDSDAITSIEWLLFVYAGSNGRLE